MRKDHGTISGEILLNGFRQERQSFLRVSGYVEVSWAVVAAKLSSLIA